MMKVAVPSSQIVMTTVAVPISLFDDNDDYNPAPSHFALTSTTTRRTQNLSMVGPE